jgi:hypothetical protein
VSKEILVGLTGRAGSGKDTVAEYIQKHYQFTQYALADPIKRGIEAMLGVPAWVWTDRAAKEATISWLGKSPRQLAQTLGTEWGRRQVRDDLWLQLGLRRWDVVRRSQAPRLVISDVRFDNEAVAIKMSGGSVWRVVREEAPDIAAHESERGINPYLITGDIKNNGTIEELHSGLDEWFNVVLRKYAQ